MMNYEKQLERAKEKLERAGNRIKELEIENHHLTVLNDFAKDRIMFFEGILQDTMKGEYSNG